MRSRPSIVMCAVWALRADGVVAAQVAALEVSECGVDPGEWGTY